MVERRAEIRPRWAFRMPRMLGADGVTRRRGGVVMRLLHVEGEPVVVRAAQPSVSRVVVGAQAERADLAEEGIARMRFALGVDDDLSAFHERFRFDPLIGPVVRSTPWLRPTRRPDPFEALAWAVTEQLIDYPRAAAIQRRIVWRLGRRCPRTGLLPRPRFPRTLADVRADGHRARVIAAAVLTATDALHQTAMRIDSLRGRVRSVRFGGLRAGRVRGRVGRATLSGAVLVPRVAVSGTATARGRHDLRVRGAMSGVLRVRGRRVTGTLDGRRVHSTVDPRRVGAAGIRVERIL